MTYNDTAPYQGGGEAYSNNSGASFGAETNRSTAFTTTISSRTPLPAATLPTGWTTCAAEHGICTATAPGMIAYGAPGAYAYQSIPAGTVPCTTSTFGTDPDYGTLKTCALAPQGGPSGYTYCADENTTCTIPGTRTVAYGLNGSFTYQQQTNSVQCTNTTFGDPLYSVKKSCFISPN